MGIIMFSSTMLPLVSSFLFVFAIVYGLLATAGVMKQKNVNVIIALVFAFFSASYQPFVTAVQGIIPIMAIVLVFLFVFVFIKNIVYGREKGKKDALPIVVCLGIALILLGTFWDNIDMYFYQLGFDPLNILWILGILIVGMIFYFVYQHKLE